jgi:mRNA interferase RelE/StbE
VAYQILVLPAAKRQLKKLPKQAQAVIVGVIEALAKNPRPSGAKKLVGEEDLYRVRTRDYRIVYEIRDQQLIVAVVKVGHRRDIYR